MEKWERECLVLLWEGRRDGFDEVKQEERREGKGTLGQLDFEKELRKKELEKPERKGERVLGEETLRKRWI